MKRLVFVIEGLLSRHLKMIPVASGALPERRKRKGMWTYFEGDLKSKENHAA